LTTEPEIAAGHCEPDQGQPSTGVPGVLPFPRRSRGSVRRRARGQGH
jgi:hypothetical protein